MPRISAFSLLALVLLLILGGALGYRFVEGYSWLDSFYMTMMVLTTVGFGEVEPPSTAGKLYSMFLMLAGIGLMLFLLSVLAETVTRRLLDPRHARRRKELVIASMKEHTVVCGYGQVGEAVCAALEAADKTVVVVDSDEEHLLRAEKAGLRTVTGDATDEEVLERAAVGQASTLISVLDDDAQNLSVVLSARQLASTLHIVARASDRKAAQKLRYAGANEAVDPHHLSGRRIAGLLLSPHLAAFLETEENEAFAMRELPLPEKLVGSSVAQASQALDVVLLAVWRSERLLLARPSEQLEAGDILLLATEPERRNKPQARALL